MMKYSVKKLDKLLDIKYFKLVSLDDVKKRRRLNNCVVIDYRANTEDLLCSVIETLAKDTYYEKCCNDIINQARDVFEFYNNTE